MKVYVIMQGEYSDIHVCGVVETEAEAQDICETLSNDEWYGDAWYDEYDTDMFQVMEDGD